MVHIWTSPALKIASFFITFASHSLHSRFQQEQQAVYKNCFDMKGGMTLLLRSSSFFTFISLIISALGLTKPSVRAIVFIEGL